MLLNEGVRAYSIEKGQVKAAQLLLKGAMNDDYAAPYPMVEISMENMIKRYVEGSEIYNPQSGTPQYYACEDGEFIVWPVPMMDFEINVGLIPKGGILKRVAGSFLPTMKPKMKVI